MSTATASRWEEAYARGHGARLLHLAGRRGAEVRSGPGFTAVVTGSWSNVDNGVVSRPAADADVAALVAWFRERRVPASWICAHGVDACLRARLLAAGLREETTGVTSGADVRALALPPVEPPQGVEIAPTRDLGEWLAVGVGTFFEAGGDDLEARRLVYGSGGELRHWVARRDGKAVGAATAFFAGGVAILEHVGVVPAERRRGIGTALALARLREARRLGCDVAVFGTTPESAALYEPLGFSTEPVVGGRWFYFRPPR